MVDPPPLTQSTTSPNPERSGREVSAVARMWHTTESRPESGLGFQVEVLGFQVKVLGFQANFLKT